MSKRFDDVATALAAWCQAQGIEGFRLDEVLEKKASNHDYLALTFLHDPHCDAKAAQQWGKDFAASLLQTHPHLGGSHIVRVYVAALPEAEFTERYTHARLFACRALDAVEGAKGVLYVPDFIDDGDLEILIVRDKVDGKRIDEDAVAAAIAAQYREQFPDHAKWISFRGELL